MQIRKAYKGLNPDLLFAEIKDFVLKRGLEIGESRMETYMLPEESAHFISRGTLTFRLPETGKECLRAHIVGSVVGETKLMLDIDEVTVPREHIDALLGDMDFIFGSFEVQGQ